MQRSKIPTVFKDNKTHAIYERYKFLGKGSFAKCYSVRNLTNGRQYVAKVHQPHLGEAGRSDIEREAKLMRQLKHPHVLRMMAICRNNGYTAIITEFCAGGNLFEMIKQRQNLTVFETRYFMRQVLQGLSYLHSKSIIHRDLKSDNIFLDHKLHVKVADFGLCKQLTHPNELTYTKCYPKVYRAPEIVQRIGYSFEVDIWAAGCLFYELLTGMYLFQKSNGEVIQNIYAKSYRIRMESYRISDELDPCAANVLRKMLKLNPAQRLSAKGILELSFFEQSSPCCLPLWCLTEMPELVCTNESPRY